MNKKNTNLSRRNFFKTSTLAAGAVLGGGAFAGTLAGCDDSKNNSHSMQSNYDTNQEAQARGRMFFTKDLDFAVLSASCERIFPKDDLGAGAIELGVPYFIDNQLAGAYGYNAREYMSGPFENGTPTQGYQTPLIRRDIFLEGIKSIENEAIKNYKKSFVDLDAKNQDLILKSFEANKVSMKGVSSSYFFSLLREMTLAGVYADPIYGGNDKMQGWKMKEFPGAQMSYMAFITDEKFQKISPMSLADMQGK
ncbi:gluconate 2-dehydrogenase subunit 3 family protein [Helicobacter cappadocius]|uniref:Gluconate 2-dehydrogenase subunit 3 family protein n=1 Tax=Helicobacter cappadocius TaxID=3063998 RepID=A0AA90PZQ0_9HELI|nr:MULTISPECIES: gluconate 2-dehydrogenase subunit 3 family protein [unclassified Helicobacter]MDO7253536.1 gluconate 2-dehydrogenase subunit 3 family protein [Helicobacter sp. faydin-H75]MDP2539463.1 gluconate 2-dehydrogenase subunit 3 family protein [Helicobacter sp. faydin-H76]